MRIIKLTLKNFKGCRHFVFDAGGQDCKVFGDNGTFKTTLYDAFLWLLFDKDSQNRADFAIKTLDKNGEPIHHLDHEVTGVFFDEVDGERIELRKVYREKWTKKRGSATETFTGHETDYYIDGVPVKKSEYTQRVAEIAPEDRFKLLTSPLFFNDHMKWQDRRELLIEIAGDVTMDDIIKANPDLKELPTILGKHSPDDYKAIIMVRRAEVNKELERIPIRIDEVSRHQPDVEGIDPDQLEQQSKELMAEQAELKRELADLMSSGNQSKIRQQIAEIDAKLLGIETDYRREVNEQIAKVEDKLMTCRAAILGAQNDLDIRLHQLKDNQKYAGTLEAQIASLRQKWHEVNDQELELCVDEVCPTCRQAIPADQVKMAQEKAVAEFNTKKAEQLEAINAEGKVKREELERVRATIAELKAELPKLEAKLKQLEDEKAGLEQQLETLKATVNGYRQQDNYKQLVVEKEQLLQALDGDQSAIKPQTEELENKIKIIEDQLVELRNAKATWELYQNIGRRISVLQAQESELAEVFETLEHELHLIEEYIKTKAELLTDKINSKFRLAEFKLFETQINGGINPICETTYKGVPWNSLNSAGRVQVGLDIIRTLQEHFQFRPPVWIDNRESIVELPEMDCQVISLIVSAEDKSLRIEGPEGQDTLFKEAI